MSVYYPQAAATLRLVLEDFDTDDASLNDKYTFTVIPKMVEVEINDYNEADTFKMELDYKNFPFDPRTLRAVGVTIHMEDMEALYNDSGRQKKIIPSDDNAVFLGFADEESIELDANNRIIRLEGRDFTALLLDQKFLGPVVDKSQPLINIIRSLLDAIKSTENIAIENRTGEDLPSPASLVTDFSNLGSKKNSKKGSSYWDVITQIMFELGLVAFIEKDKFVIDKPRNAYVGRQGFTQFVYGINLKSVKFKRKLGRFKGINIRVRGLDFEKKEVINVDIPKDATSADLRGLGENKVPVMDVNGKKVDEKAAPYITFRTTGIRDRDHLIQKGEEIYYHYSRQQLEGSLSTKEMTLPERIFNNGQASDRIERISFSKIKNGTPIEVIIDQGDMEKVSQLANVQDRKKYLVERFYNEQVAEAIARTLNKVNTPFYTKSVRFMLDSQNGFSMDLEFINIIDLDNANLEI